ncbi:MAG: NAD(P)-dependent oxidoreductase [Zestosphaera sp.]
MKIFITGIAGSLGSLLGSHFKADGNDIKRVPPYKPEKYLWKYTEDLTDEDLKGYDLIFYASEPITDRPLGTASPTAEIVYPFLPLKRVLDYASSHDVWFIYASSFNSLYGNKVISRHAPPAPTNFYGWAKASEELLIETYRRMKGFKKAIITRVSSAYGPGMRLDEMPAQVMLKAMLGKEVVVRSPCAQRIWTYNRNVLHFYEVLFSRLEKEEETIHHIVGDTDFTRPLCNMEIARWILKIIGSDVEVKEGEYEPGERGISFDVEMDPLYRPIYSFEEGVKATYEWLKGVKDKENAI